jgi:hypothetical protein
MVLVWEDSHIRVPSAKSCTSRGAPPASEHPGHRDSIREKEGEERDIQRAIYLYPDKPLGCRRLPLDHGLPRHTSLDDTAILWREDSRDLAFYSITFGSEQDPD